MAAPAIFHLNKTQLQSVCVRVGRDGKHKKKVSELGFVTTFYFAKTLKMLAAVQNKNSILEGLQS